MPDFVLIPDTKPAVVHGGWLVHRINAFTLVVVKFSSQHPHIDSAYGDGAPITP